MNLQNGFLASLMRVAALTAFFAVPLSYGIFVQAEQLFADQRTIRVEMQGNVCISHAYDLLHDVLALTPVAAGERRRDVSQFETAGCVTRRRDWPALRANLRRNAVDGSERATLSGALVRAMNALGSDSSLVYDPHPAILNLANAIGYDLPKTQSFIAESASAPGPLGSARFEAEANQLQRTTRYDVATAASDRPDLRAVLKQPADRNVSLDDAFDARIETWQKRGTDRARDRAGVVDAERRVLEHNDVLDRLLHRSIASELANEIVVDDRRLRVLWFAYGCALAISLVVAWLIASFVTRRERRMLAELRQERARVDAESERDRARSELAVREARFQAIFAESPLPIAISDMDATVVECNEAYLHLIGSIVGERPRSLLASLPAEARAILERIYGDLRTGTIATREVDVLISRRNREPVWCHTILSPIRSADGAPKHCSVMLQDVTERVERERQYRHGAMHDYLTALPNRAALVGSLERHVRRESDVPRFALLFIDVDDFKTINDTLGHAAGDASLQAVAIKLSELVRDTDTVARYGGDEFVVLLVHPQSIANVDDIAKRIGRAFARSIVVGASSITMSLSVGIVVDRFGYTSSEHVLADADAAMYKIKLAGSKRRVTIDDIRHPAPA